MEAKEYYHQPKFYSKVLRIALMVIFGILMAGVFGLLIGYFAMLLWNWLMPAIFGLGLITYWQAVGLVILSKIIFSGIAPHHQKEKSKDRSFHEWINCGRTPWQAKRENIGKWKHYHDFWKQEGKESYNAFVEKLKLEKGEKS
jgi:uncharacterized membrane protein YraQ (UPF0718 family)